MIFAYCNKCDRDVTCLTDNDAFYCPKCDKKIGIFDNEINQTSDEAK